MKKILLSLAVASMTISASAYTLETPVFWEEDFYEMAADNEFLDGNWITLGNGAAPAGLAANIFNPEGKGPYFVLYDYGMKSVPMANTDFVGGAPADEWLISPEIEVPYDATSLMFTAYAYCPKSLGTTTSSDRHSFKVMISEGGTDRSDFTEIFSNAVTCKRTDNFDSADKICSINGYQGKKVRLAFVVEGSMQGFTGFSNIKWGQYILYVDANLTPEISEEVGTPISIDYNIKAKAPETCPHLLAELYLNGEKVAENNYKKSFGVANSYVAVIQRVQFKNVYTPQSDSPIAYKIVLTPEFEGAVPSVLEGSIGFPKVLYKNNVVIEEMTGTGCGWCPRGIAALDYYAATYPGTETQGKVINIGVHNTQFGSDPMALGNERYTISIGDLNGSTSMPGCTMNRVTRGLDPTNAKKVEELLGQTSYNEAKILEVVMPEGADGYDLAGKTATVAFEVRNGYDSTMRNLSAAVVLVENDIKGKNREYNQSNYLASSTSGYDDGEYAVAAFSSLGAINAMAPFFEPFTRSGELGQETISFSKMVYQHASRGIFPSFSGVEIAQDQPWESDVPKIFTIDFDVPSTILDIKNTEIVVLIMNNVDRTIVASDIFPASKYVTESGVEEVNTDSPILISKEGRNLDVRALDGSVVEVYALDGVKLASYNVANGRVNAPAAWNGAVIVKVSNAQTVKSAKLIF